MEQDDEFIPEEANLDNLEPPRKKAFLDLGKSQRKNVLGQLHGQLATFAEERQVEMSTVLASLGTKHYYQKDQAQYDPKAGKMWSKMAKAEDPHQQKKVTTT